MSGPATPGTRETVSFEDGRMHIKRTQTVDPKFFDAIRTLRETTDTPGPLRYRGSIPLTLAGQWARECGFAIGTKGFNEYAHRKMQSGEYRRLTGA